MGAAWVDGYEPEHSDEEDGGKGGGVGNQADKTRNKTGGKDFLEMIFLSEISLPTFSAAPIYDKLFELDTNREDTDDEKPKQ